MKEQKKAIVLGTIAVLSWSTVATAFKIALQHLSNYELLLIACITALIFFSVSLTFHKKWHLLKLLSKQDIKHFAMIGLLNPVAYYLILFKAYDLLPAQIAQPLNYIWPIALLVLLAVFARQPIPHSKYIGMFLSLGGVVLISLGSNNIENISISGFGVFLALFSAVLWAAYWMMNNLLKHIDTSVAMLLNFFFGVIYLLLLTPFVSFHSWTMTAILSGVYVGIFEISMPFVCFALALRKSNNPTLINQLCYLAPFLSLFFIHIILGENINISTYWGLLLIICGILYNTYIAPIIKIDLFHHKNIQKTIPHHKFKIRRK